MKSESQSAAAISQSAPSATADDSRAGIGHLELTAAIILTLLAAGLRLAHLDRVAIEHFDEGVYAANFYAARIEDSFPDRHLYAPPLLPLLIEYSIVLGGGLHAAMWVNLAAGILLTPVLWWVGRSWFGPVAGLSAAALCAFSDVHLLYSRTALTDPLLTLLLVLSVYMIWRSICQGGIISSVLSGLLVGAAWWTKYNGWLPLAIAVAGFVAWLLWGVLPQSFADDEPLSRNKRRRDDGSRLGRADLVKVLGPRLLIICVVSVACWVPYVWNLQETGGYSAVAANHARYVVGLAGWVPSFVAQASSLRLLEGPLTTTGILVLAALCGWFTLRPFDRRSGVLLLAAGFVSAAVTAWLGSASVLLAAGIWGLKQVIAARSAVSREKLTDSASIASSESNLGAWMLSAWFVGLLVTTPLYHPYSRLSLPWLASSWLMAGLTVSLLLPRMQRAGAGTAVWFWPTVAISVAILIWQAPQSASRGVSGWQDRTAIQRFAPEIIDAVLQQEPELADNDPDQVDAVFYILAEPAMFVHLSALQVDSELNYVAQPASTLAVTTGDPGFAVYLVVGPHALSDESELTAIENISLVALLPYEPSELVWLDEYPGRPFVEWDADDPRWQFRLYRVSQQ